VRVTAVETRVISVPFKAPYVYSAGTTQGINSVIVTIRTDDGVTGIGEACGDRSVDAILGIVRSGAALLIGQDPFDLEAFLARFYRQAKWDDMRRFANQAVAGLEMALWDVIGKACNQPVYRLLGGLVQRRISFFGFIQGDSPEELADSARALVDDGFTILYLKVGRGLDRDIRAVRAVRESVGADIGLRIDANQAWSVGTAVRTLHALSEYAIEFAEQPISWSNLPGLAHIRASVPIQIAVDQGCFTEAEALAVVRGDAADVMVVGPHETGGLAALRRVVAFGEVAGIPVCRHATTGETGISTLATLHVLASAQDRIGGHQAVQQLLEADVLRDGSLTFEAGMLAVPDAPGLGIELDDDRVARYEDLYRRSGGFYNA
jgi:L-alanine-DL-glutamate epimerase-like enolase superfamily enzyme